MAYKRSRVTFEADLQAQQSPYVIYGTPLPPLDLDVRDDGLYVPIWKQEVTDEQGRKRLHGAFTGGFSAGYFNTVGSKEGWTPAAFVSSRSNRRKDVVVSQQRAEDFMDEEDMADAEDVRNIQTSDTFAGFGSTARDRSQQDQLTSILRAGGETMGVKLLRKMGWKDGQGVGPKVRRRARLNEEDDPGGGGAEMHFFAPEDSAMMSFIKKNDQKGLGFESENRLTISSTVEPSGPHNGDDILRGPSNGATNIKSRKTKTGNRTGFGVGVLNDDGSDEEDPYHMGPSISYNRAIGDDKKKKKLETIKPTANPLLKSKPVFISKKASALKGSSSYRRCHDGRLPIDGFTLSSNPNSPSTLLSIETSYPPPTIPSDWKSSKTSEATGSTQPYQSSATIAKASTLSPKSRAALLGESLLPGKSVFDYLSPTARTRIATATNNPNLPPALSEAPLPPPPPQNVTTLIPPLDSTTALTALNRSTSGGFLPYAEDPPKRIRYLSFLSYSANLNTTSPSPLPGVSVPDWVKELQEFAHAAQIFKPMTGLMATRFTSSTLPSTTTPISDSTPIPLLQKPVPKPTDPAEEAARLGLYGPLTRSSLQFFPTRLLCKRFNIRPPAHVVLDPDIPPSNNEDKETKTSTALPQKKLELVSKLEMEGMMRERGIAGGEVNEAQEKMEIDPEINEALEVERPEEAVFRAVFGSDSEDE